MVHNSKKFLRIRSPTAPLLSLIHISCINKEAGKYNNFCVHYAVKANANHKVLTIIRESGLGADCVKMCIRDRLLLDAEAEFRPDFHFVAKRCECLADPLFAGVRAIDLRRIEEKMCIRDRSYLFLLIHYYI